MLLLEEISPSLDESRMCQGMAHLTVTEYQQEKLLHSDPIGLTKCEFLSGGRYCGEAVDIVIDNTTERNLDKSARKSNLKASRSCSH